DGMGSTRLFCRNAALAIAAFLALAGFVCPAAADIIVEGVPPAQAQAVRDYFSGMSEEEVQAGLEALRASGRYGDVSVARSGGNLIVHVAAGTVINRIAFEGNSKIKTENLEKIVRLTAHRAFNARIADEDAAHITEAYRVNGRAAARVSYRVVPLPNGTIDVVFTIDEGDKTGIKEIRFVGNTVFSSGRLRSLMETTEMNFYSFLKTSDVYDPERVAADIELIRRFYLKNGYADFHIVSSDARYEPELGGYILEIVLEEGPQYRVSAVDIESHLPDIDAGALHPLLRIGPGDVYNGDAVEKTVEALTREIAHKGYAFTQARPRGQRNPVDRTVAINFVIDEGPRVFIERINIRGNTKTREYVIRREFEIGEGDPYNRVLIDRAERHLNGLGFFKKVKITNEPGSAPDRVIINVELEEQSTGSFNVSGGYSTTEGFIGEVSVSDSNFMGRGEAVRLALNEGQRARGVTFSFTEPYFLDQRMSAGFDLFARKSDAWTYSYYSQTSYGATLRVGLPITEEITLQPHYSIYNTEISIPNDHSRPYDDCQQPIPFYTPGFGYWLAPYPNNLSLFYNCMSNGEASLAIKDSVGSRLTSAIGYTTGFNNLDNLRNPRNGSTVTLTQDVAGLGGDSRFLRTTGEARYYHDLDFLNYGGWNFLSDMVGVGRIQAGNLLPLAGYQPRVSDNFNLGSNLVRGFAPGGIGPRDVSNWTSTRGNPLGGTDYVGATAEVQFPIWGLPKDIGLRGAVFNDAGTLWGYRGKTFFPQVAATNLLLGQTSCLPFTAPTYGQGSCLILSSNEFKIRDSVGVSLLWQSPLGPIRFDYSFPIVKGPNDVTKRFNFSGGTTF
ncbi:MAG TPA: outer membrane protein assembly factor BamA, partial [Roseiarcus sp.]|nr:outer membrane protein assembly factor BamA [Roseiarcus sp.]